MTADDDGVAAEAVEDVEEEVVDDVKSEAIGAANAVDAESENKMEVESLIFDRYRVLNIEIEKSEYSIGMWIDEYVDDDLPKHILLLI
ncbi:unnamed protein product [Ambrosiozyma monospora]|uniref:Unnamed protein product n=1 Tax=Ambrosiozyma monospora TaxID=43982 RepID=A0ACB5TB17_AMBMO|nr:unnamed protein product [Ambrosiozyma monospora]